MEERDIEIVISSELLSLELSRDFVAIPEAGGVVIFEGLVRNHTKGKEVIRLEFESYEKMAISELRKIVQAADLKFEIHRVSIQHRVGVCEIGDTPVIIAVSSSHRKAAFEACEFIIDQLKQTVPIWKKEFFIDGETWVTAHP